MRLVGGAVQISLKIWRGLGWAAALVVFVLLASCQVGRGAPELRDGDLIFQTSTSAQSVAIQRATGSRYSHMGMVVYRNGEPYVLEASSTVRFTPLEVWIRRGRDGHYVVKRLVGDRVTSQAMQQARVVVRALQGKSYDFAFGWSDHRMYCSELVWKIYERVLGVHIGELQRLGDFELSDPVVQAKLRERYGERVPLEEPVISPAAMFDSPLLELVVAR